MNENRLVFAFRFLHSFFVKNFWYLSKFLRSVQYQFRIGGVNQCDHHVQIWLYISAFIITERERERERDEIMWIRHASTMYGKESLLR